ncbi:MAG: hypothetical protein R8G66_00860 [Cytophagales bacterium]|nr:hypothetical protein [Cytophagales bacterium]
MKAQSSTLSHQVKPLSLPQTETAFNRFVTWADKMDYYRLIILVGIILAQGCITLPFALWVMNIAGDSSLQMFVFIFSSFTMITMILAVQPMRRTLPLFFALTALQWLITAINLIGLI